MIDMFLEAEIVNWGFKDENKKENQEIRQFLAKFKRFKGIDKIEDNYKDDFMEIGGLGYIKVRVGLAYWRNASAIHKWFIKNVQDGNKVSREKLKELQELCRQIIENPELAEKLLPGDYYNIWYFLDIQATANIIEKALSLPEEFEFIYYFSRR